MPSEKMTIDKYDPLDTEVNMPPNRPVQIKICGLMDLDDAVACANYGADAIGFIFYPKSPRYVRDEQAREISLSLGGAAKTVGVFVNETESTILKKIDTCLLDTVQLHGNESVQLVERLIRKGVRVIKALFEQKAPDLTRIYHYPASAFLVECGRGKLPGGNAMTWNWGQAKPVGLQFPLILAGGLDPQNVEEAIVHAEPDAVDVSSGVEISPGKKDMNKVKAFIKTVRRCQILRKVRNVF